MLCCAASALCCCRCFSEKTQSVSLLSSDSHRIESWAVNLCANNKKLLKVVADGGGNIHVLQYDKDVSTPAQCTADP